MKLPAQPVVVITGASSGIGWATARLLAERGCRLVLAARREERLRDLAATLERVSPGNILLCPTDVRDASHIARLVERTVATFGRLDVVINNAGILDMEQALTHSSERMRDIFETNFWPLVSTLKCATPVMERQGGGHFVQVGSIVSRRGLPFMAAYAASKFALTGLTEALRTELAPRGITLTLVYPGSTDTEMPQKVNRTRLPPGYPSHDGMRMSAERAARAVVKGVFSRPREIYVPWWGRPTAWVCAFWPGAVDLLLRWNYRRIQWR